MIKKVPRNNTNGKYDLIVTDKNGNSFIMLVGGNLDLYWVPENYKENKVFEIDKNDEIVYNIFEQLFDAIGKRDNQYRPVLKDDTITYISEEFTEEESNSLKIRKIGSLFNIEFIKNENQESWTVPHRDCTICFCNSGSRVPKVEALFMRMFNYLAYECPLIPLDTKNDPTL